MWNKPQSDSEPQSQPEPQASPPSRPVGGTPSRQAVLGPSISIKGNVSGDEDVLIEGQIDGEISFGQNTVTIGTKGRVKADIHCKVVYVEGHVTGNLFGEEKVVVRQSGHVEGNAVAPRVVLEEGANFRGNIDMQPRSGKQAATAKS